MDLHNMKALLVFFTFPTLCVSAVCSREPAVPSGVPAAYSELVQPTAFRGGWYKCNAGAACKSEPCFFLNGTYKKYVGTNMAYCETTPKESTCTIDQKQRCYTKYEGPSCSNLTQVNFLDLEHCVGS